MGIDTLEYPLLSVGFAELHGRLHHLGKFLGTDPGTRNSTAYCSQLAPITGVLLADYYIVHRQTYDVEEMYIPGGKYQYNKYGTNWRAVAAWLAGCLPLIGGFAAAVCQSFSFQDIH